MELSKQLEFYIEDQKHTVRSEDVDAGTSLNDYLRGTMKLTGTKVMCREGGCGVCVVAATTKHPVTMEEITFSINSCLVSLFSCSGWKISTIEGIGNRTKGHHPIQTRLAEYNGTQCGFCSSGMVMNMFAMYQKSGTSVTMKEIENAFGGNLCRCTGYRSILNAFKTMTLDIEDLPPCKSQENCQKLCTVPCTQLAKQYQVKGTSAWYKVFLIEEIFDVLAMNKNKTYNLVAGNTAKGVYRDMALAAIYIDILSVKELQEYKITSNGLQIGANTSLTDVMKIFTNVSKTNPEYAYLSKFSDHIDLVAHVPVRNVGSIAGNLSIKRAHKDFPSDIFLLLETVSATLVIVNSLKQETRLRPSDYLVYDMNNKVIKSIILPALDASYKFGSYKIMPRAQNAHAHVNAGFLFKLNAQNIIESAKIVYGGINPNFIHATRTEQYFVDKPLFDDGTLQGAYAILDQELIAEAAPPEPSPKFRKALAIALLYKFVLSKAPNVSEKNRSGGQLMVRPLSEGTQDYTTDKTMYPITQPVRKLEALAQTSGEAQYIIDIPDKPGQLHGYFLLAKAPAGSIILKKDTTEALKLKGVAGFVDYTDIKGVNNFQSYGNNEEIFSSGKIIYFGQPIGLVMATSLALAVEAANLIKVTYKPPTSKSVVTIQDIIKNNDKSRMKHESTIVPRRKGNDTKHELKGYINLHGQYHFHMETQTVNIAPVEDDSYEVYPGTQFPDAANVLMAQCMNIPQNKIDIKVRRLGGAFGAKLIRSQMVICAAFVGCVKLGKPVRIWMPFEDNMSAIGKRNMIYCTHDSGFNDNGLIQYIKMEHYVDYGSITNDSPLPLYKPVILELYQADTYEIDIIETNTDVVTSTWTRAPGSLEAIAIMEMIMEQASVELNLDPVDIRLANVDSTKHPKLIEFIKDMRTWAEYDKRKADIAQFNKVNRWRKRALTMTTSIFQMLFDKSFTVILSIYWFDGTVAISHGGIEIGQGINTKAAQVVAHFLGIPLESVTVKPGNNLSTPNSFMTGGSVGSEMVCAAFVNACKQMNARLQPVRDSMPKDTKWLDLIHKCYELNIHLTVADSASVSEMLNYSIYGVILCEVEVDILTGNQMISRVDLIEDVGDSISPIIDVGQVEGALSMGLGYWLTEELIYSDQGELLNNRTWNYKPPGAKDIPVKLNVKFPKNSNEKSVLKGKATGEPPLCLAVCAYQAVREAVRQARAEADPKAKIYYMADGPSTVESTFMNSLNDYKQYTLK